MLKMSNRYRDAVTVKTPSDTQDAGGGFARSWTTLFSGYAKIKVDNRWEEIVALQDDAGRRYKIEMAYDSRLETHRLAFVWGSRWLVMDGLPTVDDQKRSISFDAWEREIVDS